MHIAFVVGEFPAASEPFIINQIADLRDTGVTVDVFSFRRGDASRASERYHAYGMDAYTRYLAPPKSKLVRALASIPLLLRLLFLNPAALIRMVRLLAIPRERGEVLSLKYLFWMAPFVGHSYDLVHCHFGTIAAKYARIRPLIGDRTPLVTTLYGYDVSHVIAQKGPGVYQALHEACSRYLVMSNDMRERAIAAGFPSDRITVHPVSLPVQNYPFSAHVRTPGEPVHLMCIARLVEKKGIEDLLHALAHLRTTCDAPFQCTIVGDGPLRDDLHALAHTLDLDDVVTFTGAIPFEEVNALLSTAHIYMQPSKVARNGDME